MSLYDEYSDKAVIYKLTCSTNGKIYIGKTINLKQRFQRYKNFGDKSKGRYHFQNAILKYGWDSFSFEILETFDKTTSNDELLMRESYYIELFESSNRDKGYNICKHSVDRTGMKHSEESKAKMRLRRHSEDSKKKISESCKGILRSEKTKTKMSESAKKRECSDETKDWLRTVNVGRICSDETREKLRQANKGKPRSKETVEKIRQTKLRKKLLNEQST